MNPSAACGQRPGGWGAGSRGARNRRAGRHARTSLRGAAGAAICSLVLAGSLALAGSLVLLAAVRPAWAEDAGGYLVPGGAPDPWLEQMSHVTAHPPGDPQSWPCANRKPHAALCGIEPYGLNYFLPATFDSQDHPQRLPLEAKLQISLRKELAAFSYGSLYASYTQLSFWQVYDGPGSRPFRETNYNPELFAKLKLPALRGAPDFMQVGLEHESNGQGLAASRSWNRLYVQPQWGEPFSAPVTGSLKVWARIAEPAKTSPTDAAGDDNPGIESYLGYAEARVYWLLGGKRAQLALRRGSRDNSGSVRLDFQAPIGDPGAGLFWHVQYFYGYGESLIDFDQLVQRVGVGFSFE